MICESKLRENKIFLGTQYTQERVRGYSRATNTEFEQHTLFFLSFSQRSSEGIGQYARPFSQLTVDFTI